MGTKKRQVRVKSLLDPNSKVMFGIDILYEVCTMRAQGQRISLLLRSDNNYVRLSKVI